MIAPKLDSRGPEDILAEIRHKSEVYTPEWRLDFKQPDGGGALARLFAEMFFETVERYNRFPDKSYLEFLNMLGIGDKAVSPAVGMAEAKMVPGAAGSVFIKKNTRLFTDIAGEGGDTRVIFETAAGYYATPAEIKAIYRTDPDGDVITRSDPSEEGAFPLALFAPEKSANLERHCFAFAHAKALRIGGAAEIRVKISDSAAGDRDETILSRLCDPEFAEWSYFSGNGKERFTARVRGDCIALFKNSREPIALTVQDDSGETLPWIFCEMSARSGKEEIVADGISVSSVSINDALHRGIVPDCIFANDAELNAEKCGYCFGHEPNIYDSFFICCDEVFSKSRADVTAEFTVHTVLYRDSAQIDAPELGFHNRLLVDKDELGTAPYDNIRISEVLWEYWNGFGWARLEIGGDPNPFSCEGTAVKKTVRFTCPDDIAPSVQNAREGLWIRARVSRVENRYSTRAQWLLPLLKSVMLRYDYGDRFLPADRIVTMNNLERGSFLSGSGTPMKLFRIMPERYRAVYFMFDRPPEGFPVNIYLEIAGSADAGPVISFQRLTGDGSGRTSWTELKTSDRTNGFSHSGILSLYCPKDFCEAELFGERGFWIRAVNRGAEPSADRFGSPRLTGIVMNAVEIVQKQSVSDERHSVRAGAARQLLKLSGKPVISCGLWVNELSETPLSELRRLKERDRASVRMITDEDGQASACWVRWEKRDTLMNSGAEDRHFTLDASEGVIRFGDGVNGRIPAYSGTAEISVDYSYGGGKAGNLPAGSIDGLVVGIPFVDGMTNFRPTCGGSDGQSTEAIREIGAGRLKHFGRAVTAEDFEILVLEEFIEVSEVRCFPNRSADDTAKSGCVTVVVMPHDYTDTVYASSLCRRIYDYLADRADALLILSGGLKVIPVSVMRVSAEIMLKLDGYEYAAETERNAALALNTLINGGAPRGKKIGFMPTAADVVSALKRLDHVSGVSGVMLIGEYYRGSRKMTVSLSGSEKYRFFAATGGEHTIKLLD